VRDSLSLLDQIIAFSGRSISVTDVATILGLSETNFFARVVTHISEGDHAGVLDALQEAADTGRDFKMLYRDLLNFVRNLLLLAGGANEQMLAVAPEDLPVMRTAADQFSYTDLLRIANLLLRDDETVNRAEHQRLAVEIALLKAATFPRLKSVEQVIAGNLSAPAPAPAAARPRPPQTAPQAKTPHTPDTRHSTPPQPTGPDDLIARVRQKRPGVATVLVDATMERTGNKLIFIMDDSFHAETVSDAKDVIAQIASELYGEKMTVETRVGSAEPAPTPGRRADDKPTPLRDDPVVSSFRKHLGGELVKEKR
jgi:DNA polymerase-3 subunit gamma/tau